MKAKDSFATQVERFDLIRKADKRTEILFVGLFLLSIAAYVIMIEMYDFTVYTGLPIMSTPFFIIGLIFYVVNRRYMAVIFILALTVVTLFLLPAAVLFIIYLLVCTEGVAQMVEVIQRRTFYGIIQAVERVNIKSKITLKDRIIVFFFNIPVDLDTRNLKIDTNISRNKLPWRDMLDSIALALLFCMFLWIYVFLNPSFSLGTTGVPIYTFTIILYMSMLVMPWTIFNTLNVRIGTDYRDFKLYKGFLETFKRMFLPIFAALLFLAAAVYSGPDNLYYIGMSLVMIVVMIVFTSVMYYTSNEMVLVNDILDRWPSFHPAAIYSRFDEKETELSTADLPGTPRRDPKECFSLDVKARSR